ncbi:hypothetical protein OCAE111667_24745 [Occultella aeris]|uniref:Uncharacterized protein n=1 Tax=Occultella aeris TaxID=2761496 RepID=A0A7M4DHD4_9MICO|nr:hypothetical protein HALOF300_01531 [Occultella aeris]
MAWICTLMLDELIPSNSNARQITPVRNALRGGVATLVPSDMPTTVTARAYMPLTSG